MTDTPLRNEYTPLLSSVDDFEGSFPAIKNALESLSDFPDMKDLHDAYPRILDDIQPLHTLAFRLILALELLISIKVIDIYESRNIVTIMSALRDQARREEHIQRLITSILEEISASTAHSRSDQLNTSEAILAISFTKETSKQKSVRVLDLLNHSVIPHAVLRNQFLFLSLLRLWSFGISRLRARPALTTVNLFLHKYDAAISPRGLHALHLIFHLCYLALLAHFVLYPLDLANGRGSSFGIREGLIVIYGLSNIAFRHGGFASCSHLLIVLSFIVSLPSSPLPDSSPYTFILGSLCLHILELSFLSLPNIFMLFDPIYWLPISSLYATSFRISIIPAFIFLFPMLLGSSLLLAFSLSEEVFTIGLWVYHKASPLVARTGFLGLFCISCVLFVHLTVIMLSTANVSTEWTDILSFSDRYGRIFGDQARRSILRIVWIYSPIDDEEPVLFLPPFNLLDAMLKKSPRGALWIRTWTWRIMVLPLALIAGFRNRITRHMQADA